jgi:hypothetical protein
MMRKTFFILVSLFCGQLICAANPMIKKFDHDLHDKNVFAPNAVECKHCHNIEVGKSKGEYVLNSKITSATFQQPLKLVCHECHKVSDSNYNAAKYDSAPKACYTCHDSFQQISNIMPQSHQDKFWKKNHGMTARVESASCMNCHSTSQCTTCHTKRNDLSPKNHMRNYRYFHSVEARLAPQKCDACHNKTYCTTCHMGKK